MISADLLEILACPACDTRPRVTLEADRLVCSQCHRRYPIRDGIPVMLVDEAELPAGGRGGEGRPEAGPSGNQDSERKSPS